ncbi:MAG: GYD domain-containing protein [Candidatus Omnitrophica bacterium]|nr:GYD domain-containing protein [Candidatus Omnitrophota bacterium]
MPRFIQLANLTETGVKKIDEFPVLLSSAAQIIVQNGARLIDAYATLGRYDLVLVIDAPSDSSAAKISALIAAQGNFRAETLSAISIEDFGGSFTR